MTVKQVYDKALPNFVVDKKKAELIKRFYLDFVHRNSEHVNFFGSGLLAVNKIRWVDEREVNFWFSEILEGLDPEEMRSETDQLPDIDPNHNVASDPFNLSVIWVIHKIYQSRQLTEQQRIQTATYAMAMMIIRFISSTLYRFFEFGTDEQIALQTYEAMNYKFELKVYGTWSRLILAKANQAVTKKSIHYSTFQYMRADDDVTYAISDAYTRIRRVIKLLTKLYYDIRDNGSRIASVSSMIEVDGSLSLKDISRNTSKMRRYIETTIVDQPSFIRYQVTEAIISANPSMNRNHFIESLQYLSSNYLNPKEKRIPKFVDKIIEFAFDMIAERNINPKDFVAVLAAIKGVVTAPRNKEPDVLYLRNEGDKIVRSATGVKSPQPVSSERTGVIMYIVLRAMTMNQFN